MQYVVQVSGEVLDKQNKAYVIDSKTDEEAQLIATQTFCEDFAIESDACMLNHISVLIKLSQRSYLCLFPFCYHSSDGKMGTTQFQSVPIICLVCMEF